MRDDAFDRAVLARGISALEDHKNPVAATDEVPLQLHQFDLQAL